MDKNGEQAATDPSTGLIDMDKITTGYSASDRTQMEQQSQAVLNLLQETRGGTIKFKALLKKFNDQSDVVSKLGLVQPCIEECSLTFVSCAGDFPGTVA